MRINWFSWVRSQFPGLSFYLLKWGHSSFYLGNQEENLIIPDLSNPLTFFSRAVSREQRSGWIVIESFKLFFYTFCSSSALQGSPCFLIPARFKQVQSIFGVMGSAESHLPCPGASPSLEPPGPGLAKRRLGASGVGVLGPPLLSLWWAAVLWLLKVGKGQITPNFWK